MAEPVSPIRAELTERLDQIHRQQEWLESLHFGDGNGTLPPMDAWPASVDRRLEQSEKDIRDLLRHGLYAVVALATMVGGLYFYINAEVGVVDQRVQQLEVTVSRMDERQKSMDAKLDTLIARK